MAGNSQGRGEATRQQGLAVAIDNAWDDAKANGAEPDVPLTIQQIQVVGNNPIHTYIVIVGPSS
jgi:hypothetical protein